MSTWEKLIARLRSLDRNMRYEELRTILEHYGYTSRRPRSGSNHCTFRKTGHPPITIPHAVPVKLTYIIQVRDIVESEAKTDD